MFISITKICSFFSHYTLDTLRKKKNIDIAFFFFLKCAYAFDCVLYILGPAEEKWRRGLCLRFPNITLEHPYNCAKYYVCDSRNPIGTMARIEECDFPYLFNPNSERCEHYSIVKCGQRYEPKNQCKTGFYISIELMLLN
jgi:hypothetical protein